MTNYRKPTVFSSSLTQMVATVLLTFLILYITAPARASARATGTTFTVNTTSDTVDADVGVPACIDANGKCSLRAAIMQANWPGPVCCRKKSRMLN